MDIFVEAFPPTGEPGAGVPTPASSPAVPLVESKPVHVPEMGQPPALTSEPEPAVDSPAANSAPTIQAGPPAETGFIPLGVAGFQFNVPKIEGKGEDADPVAVWQSPRGFLSVFDGMGGAGSTTYLHRGIPYSGAYIASRLAAEEVKSLFSPAFPLPSIPFDVREIKDRLSAALQREATTLESGAEPSRLKSKMLRRLPTTMAGILVELAGGEVLCQTMWAGDSRCYALVPDQGLQQLTNDDLKVSGDALENLKSDSPLSNCLNADGDFEVRSQSAKFSLPAILLSATDGCFGYLFSPAHFEFLLLDTLMAAIDMGQWRDLIVARLKTIAGDDCSLCLLAIGWASYTEMQAAFSGRRLKLAQEYIEPLDELTQAVSEDAALLRQVEDRKAATEKRRETLRQELWTRYKPAHDHFLKRDEREQEGTDTL